MENELIKKGDEFLQDAGHFEIQLSHVEEDYPVSRYTKLSLSRVLALGTAFDPLASVVQKIISAPGTVSGLYKVTIPSGMHLAEFKSGIGNLGTALNIENQIAGQAVLNPIVCNPTMVFMAATLANIDKKLDAIQVLQQEMMDFLTQEKRSEQRGDLVFLSDILNNYRFNWNNDTYKNSNHVKVLDIRQTAEKNIIFYREQIKSKLQRKNFIHSDKDARKQIERISLLFKDYQLTLYVHGFSSFLDAMLVGNFNSEYLKGITQKLEDYSFQYRELYTNSYDYLKSYAKSSFQSSLIRGIKNANESTSTAINRLPPFNKNIKTSVFFAEVDSKLDSLATKGSIEQLAGLVGYKGGFVRPFIENIETICQLYNHSLDMVFDKEAIYLGVADS